MKSLLIMLTAFSALGHFSAAAEARDTNANVARSVRYRGNVNVRRVPNRYPSVYRRPTPMKNVYRGARFSAPF